MTQYENAFPVVGLDMTLHIQTRHLLGGSDAIWKQPQSDTTEHPWRFRIYDGWGHFYGSGTFESLEQLEDLLLKFREHTDRNDVVLRVYNRSERTLHGIYPYGEEKPYAINPRPVQYQGRTILRQLFDWAVG